MTDSARYVKIVEWSDEDATFIGLCPGVIGPCCHGGTLEMVQLWANLPASMKMSSRKT